MRPTLSIAAEFDDGSEVTGESHIADAKKERDALEALRDADTRDYREKVNRYKATY